MKKIIYCIFLCYLTLVSCNDTLLQPDIDSLNSETPSPTSIPAMKKVQGDGKHDLLGWGYDPSIGYLNPNEYNKLQVIDVDRLYLEQTGNFYHGSPNTNLSTIVAGSDAIDWSFDLTSKFSGSATYKVVTASMKRDITINNSISTKSSYATYFMTVSLQREKLYHSIDVLKSYLTPTFITAINTLSPNQIINNYGTHVFTDITIGGKLEVNFKSLANSSSKKITVNSGISAAIEKVFSLNADNSVGYAYKDLNTDVKCTYKTIGGDPSKCIFGEITDATQSYKTNLNTWSQSVTLNNSEIVDIGESSLIPIYEFVSDPIRKEAIKTAVNNYLNSKMINLVNGSIKCSFSLSKSTDRIVSLDYNNDGIMDILCYSPGYNTVCLNGGLNDGTFYNVFTNSNGLSGYDFANINDQVIAFDYNGDKYDDLMCYRPKTGIVYIFRSNGDATFTLVNSSRVGVGGYDFASIYDKVIALDYDGDGKDDLMCYRPGSGIVYIMKSNGNGSFTPVNTSRYGIAGFDFTSTLDKAISFDYNGDGYDDILMYRPGYKFVYIAKSNGNGSFTNVYASSNGIGGYDFSNKNDLVISLNYDGDQYSDLLCYRPGSSFAYLLKSNGNASFALAMQTNNGIVDYDLSNTNDKIISMDYNNDKRSDLILYRPGTGTAYSASSSGFGQYNRDYPY